MRRLLITGGAGFIGASFVHHWAHHHPNDRLLILDAMSYAADKKNLDGLPDHCDWQLVEGNICDATLLDQLFNRQAIDTVVHFAAESHVDRSISGPAPFMDSNINGTFQLLEAARRHWQDRRPDEVRFHHISTDEVYGSLSLEDPAFSEDSPYDPSSPYSASKAASDHLVRAWHRTYGLPITLSNCCNNFGPRQYPEKLIPVVIRKAINGEAIPVYGDGSNVREWLYVDDHSRAVQAIIERGEVGRSYNVGSGLELSNIELVKRLCAKLDQIQPRADGHSYQEQIQFVTDRPGHDLRYAINSKRIHTELGWQPSVDFEDGLAETLRWYLD